MTLYMVETPVMLLLFWLEDAAVVVYCPPLCPVPVRPDPTDPNWILDPGAAVGCVGAVFVDVEFLVDNSKQICRELDQMV